MIGFRPSRTSIAAAVLVAGLAGCGGGGSGFDITDPVGSVVNMALEGTFADMEGLAADFTGDQAVITDHGDSIFSTNPSIFPVGSALIDDISCGPNSCTGQVAVPVVVNGTIVGIQRETGTVTKSGDTLTLSSPSLGEKEYTPYTPPAGGGGTPAELTSSASCREWFDAMAAVGTWKITHVRDTEYDAPPPQEVTLRFFGTNSYEWTNNAAMGLANATGVFHFDDNIFGTGQCRFYFDDGLSVVVFPQSLSGGVARFNRSSDSDYRYWELAPN